MEQEAEEGRHPIKKSARLTYWNSPFSCPSGQVNERIQATASSTSGTLADIIAAAGGGAAAFPQSSYTLWTTIQYTDCCLAASERIYHTIPASGTGSSGANYDEFDIGYDVMKRPNRAVTPGGTIIDLVRDARGNVTGIYVGTNDDGATETDPTGGGAGPDNNMVLVRAKEFDGGAPGGDGNLTEVARHVNATTQRITSMAYDFRDRHITTVGEVDYFEQIYFDNLDRVYQRDRHDSTAGGNLIGRNQTNFDDRNQIYQTIRYGVDPSTGTVGNSLIDNIWRDASGNVIKSLPRHHIARSLGSRQKVARKVGRFGERGSLALWHQCVTSLGVVSTLLWTVAEFARIRVIGNPTGFLRIQLHKMRSVIIE